MSKRQNSNNFIKKTAETQYIASKEPLVPKKLIQDPEFRFGRSSGAYNDDSQRIGGIINYEYLKEHLTESIQKKAMEDLDKSKKTTKDWRNKVFHLRSQSVAK